MLQHQVILRDRFSGNHSNVEGGDVDQVCSNLETISSVFAIAHLSLICVFISHMFLLCISLICLIFSCAKLIYMLGLFVCSHLYSIKRAIVAH